MLPLQSFLDGMSLLCAAQFATDGSEADQVLVAVQVGVFSATLPPEALEITKKFMNNPVRILVKRDELTLEGIKQVRATSVGAAGVPAGSAAWQCKRAACAQSCRAPCVLLLCCAAACRWAATTSSATC